MYKSNWKENIKWDMLNTDPYFVKIFKLIRKQIRIYRNLLITLVGFATLSFIFVYSGFEEQFENNKLYRAFLIFLNIVTFIGIIAPISVKKNLSKDNVKDIIKDKEEQDKKNKLIEDRNSF
jgi:hypothetical protein